MDNVEIIENRFIELYNCNGCYPQGIEKCSACVELKRIDAFIKEHNKHFTRWEIFDGINNACEKLQISQIHSLITLNFFFTIPDFEFKI